MPKKDWIIAEEEFAAYIGRMGKNAWLYKFLDTREAMGATGSRRVYTQSRPSDFLVTIGGRTFFAEIKSSQDHVSFPFSSISRDQWKAAIQMEAAKGDYRFYIKNVNTHQWYLLFAQFIVPLQRAGIKSLKWADISNHKLELI